MKTFVRHLEDDKVITSHTEGFILHDLGPEGFSAAAAAAGAAEEQKEVAAAAGEKEEQQPDVGLFVLTSALPEIQLEIDRFLDKLADDKSKFKSSSGRGQ